ncbi:hypothetical protein [Kingella negevensis]|uniref:Uncharacterized protein n=1 Tax=Kingella negevensis TaxID=1522312 RepID=A0A238HG98_9NEIS|nr:hypothetical protein [Kingella negevensis]MDK4680921.1 hypothetical protein [Kingella negevensis]MDK4683123.1 hypothetical protein [Kingella negevensis]MDK4683994.1 hypothetical protein [Kingella negevensis]MDK4691745.1 hypothetical protein [Kingella negevensis]MDK4693103.1 hypothetical protein [Kingella negevensis]
MHTLNLTQSPITLVSLTETQTLALTLSQIEQQLAQFPPTDYAWETAIQTVEDALFPLRDWQHQAQPVIITGADTLCCLPHTTQGNQAHISRDTLEHAFAIIAGYRPKNGLLPLPETVPFCALLLFIREWAHHLNFEDVIITIAA